MGGGGLACVGRFALLCRLVSPLAEGVAKDCLKQLPRGVGALLLWVGLLFLCRLECPLLCFVLYRYLQCFATFLMFVRQ